MVIRRGAIEPSFTMTGDTAVAEVLPTTEQVQSQVFNAFSASLGLGLPGSSTSSSNAQTAATSKGSNMAEASLRAAPAPTGGLSLERSYRVFPYLRLCASIRVKYGDVNRLRYLNEQ